MKSHRFTTERISCFHNRVGDGEGVAFAKRKYYTGYTLASISRG